MSSIKRILNNSVVIMTGAESNVGTQTGEEIKDVDSYLLNKRPEIALLTLDDFKYKMVYAPIQSGKTSMLICKALELSMKGYVVTIVVRDYRMDLIQLQRRLEEVRDELIHLEN